MSLLLCIIVINRIHKNSSYAIVASKHLMSSATNLIMTKIIANTLSLHTPDSYLATVYGLRFQQMKHQGTPESLLRLPSLMFCYTIPQTVGNLFNCLLTAKMPSLIYPLLNFYIHRYLICFPPPLNNDNNDTNVNGWLVPTATRVIFYSDYVEKHHILLPELAFFVTYSMIKYMLL